MKFAKILLSLAACVLAFSGTAMAQDDDHGMILVRTTTVKTGKGQQYRALLAQLAAARSAAGHTGVNIWQVIRGPSSTYYMVMGVDNYADFDGGFDSGMSDADWARWLNRASDLVDNSVVTMLRTHRELTIAAEEGSAPNMVMLRFTTLKPGNASDHHEWLQESLRPNMMEGGRKGWNVSNVTMGDDVNTWVSSTRVDSWEQLDGPGPFDHMSERSRNNMFEDYSERVESARVELIRHLPDLSY